MNIDKTFTHSSLFTKCVIKKYINNKGTSFNVELTDQVLCQISGYNQSLILKCLNALMLLCWCRSLITDAGMCTGKTRLFTALGHGDRLHGSEWFVIRVKSQLRPQHTHCMLAIARLSFSKNSLIHTTLHYVGRCDVSNRHQIDTDESRMHTCAPCA